MKLKSILVILCLIAGAGLIQLSAQNPEPEGNSYWVESTFGTYVICDGEFTDWIGGVMKAHVVDKYKDGIWVRQIIQIHGEASSWKTDEEFKFKRVGKYYPTEDKSIFHYNLLGDEGTHYILKHLYEFEPTWSITVISAKCH